MKKRLSIRRIIILLSIVLVYSVALCFISTLAKKAIIDDIIYSGNALTPVSGAFLNKNADHEADQDNAVEAVAPNYYEKLEKIDEKAEIGEYDFLAQSTTQIIVETKAPESAETTVSTTSPKPISEPTTPKATESTAPPVTTAPKEETTPPATTTEEPTVEEDDLIDEDIMSDPTPTLDDDVEDDPEVTISTDDIVSEIYDEDYIQSILDEFFKNQSTPQIYYSDILNNGKSYKNEKVTIYDKSSGRYLTDNAFDIVCQVTFNEIGTSKHPEAIKAQAVAVYSYIKHYEQKGEYASLRLKSNPPQLIIDCVNAVDGLAMYYNGEYIMAAFSASTAGVTCSSENVWGGFRPYLRSVVSEFDHFDEKNYCRVTTYTADELKKKIESKTNIVLSSDPQNWITILSYGDGGYVDKIAIDGHTTATVSGSEKTLTAHVFRSNILSIRSTCFTVSYQDGVFTFVTYGYGHGVGMSQNGAGLYAQYAGYSFDQILHHYYTDIVIQ